MKTETDLNEDIIGNGLNNESGHAPLSGYNEEMPLEVENETETDADKQTSYKESLDNLLKKYTEEKTKQI